MKSVSFTAFSTQTEKLYVTLVPVIFFQTYYILVLEYAQPLLSEQEMFIMIRYPYLTPLSLLSHAEPHAILSSTSFPCYSCDIMSQRKHHLILFLPKLQPHGIQITSASSGFWYFYPSLGPLYSGPTFYSRLHVHTRWTLLFPPVGAVWGLRFARGCWILPHQWSSAEQTQIMKNVVSIH